MFYLVWRFQPYTDPDFVRKPQCLVGSFVGISCVGFKTLFLTWNMSFCYDW